MGICSSSAAAPAPPDVAHRSTSCNESRGPETASRATSSSDLGQPQRPKERRRRRPTLAALKRQFEAIATPSVGKRKKPINALLRSGSSVLRLFENQSVLVAVRVRPPNAREVRLESETCVECEKGGQGITLSGTGAISGLTGRPDENRRFGFDVVLNPKATQQEVYELTAKPILNKCMMGYNGTIFAYGQTGSGKTYTMQGEEGKAMGVIPLLCKELFSRIKAQQATRTCDVSCSYASAVEIYNERLRDLLVTDGRELAIREDRVAGGRGIYVKGARHIAVSSFEEVSGVLAEGQSNRATAQTDMNEHSSRSHAVLTLTLTAMDADDDEAVTRTTAKLHLIDLAGSERQSATGATGERLKEGAKINLSLSALGNVINALTTADEVGGAQARRRTIHVPYRDSKLTRLLQDSLGGNSLTQVTSARINLLLFRSIITNVSPAACCADVTLSSLRFAERAKKVENKAQVNRDPKVARIAELLEENAVLAKELERVRAYVEKLEEFYDGSDDDEEVEGEAVAVKKKRRRRKKKN